MATATANFFAQQQQARSRTTLLTSLFVLAVACIIAAMYFIGLLVAYLEFTDADMVRRGGWWNPVLAVSIAGGVVLFIGLASFFKTLALKKGGGAVAKMLGGRKVDRGSRDLREKRLLNVIEEMAIASGVPMPEAYVLENELGINAFAAGFSVNDAAVAVTRGTLERLNRDELQGVIGHEFSHILNGDMRLNIRLIGIIFGILAIGVVGRVLLRAGSSSRSSRSSKSGGAVIVMVLVGLLMMLVGYIGTLVGRIIQAAVSRQREYLADSSAVQFTRNPSGLAGALQKIGGLAEGSRLKTAKAEQASHMFFGQGVKVSLFSGWLATHPPLVERIQRIDPRFDGKFRPTTEAVSDQDVEAEAAHPSLGQGLGRTLQMKAGAVAAAVGQPTPAHVEYGKALRASLPDAAREALAAPRRAAQLVYALLLSADQGERDKQIKLLAAAGAEDAAGAARLFDAVKTLDPRARLPLVDLATPSLRDLPYKDLSRFLNLVEALVSADSKVTLSEFCLHRLLNDRLVAAKPDNIAYRAIDPLLKDLVALLGATAQYGNPTDAAAAGLAFRAGCDRIAPLALAKPTYDFAEKPAFGKVGAALTRLSLADFPIREQVVDAAAHCVLADETVTVEEAELLRVICSSLACPLPPFLPQG